MSSGMRRRGPGRSENQVEHRPSTDQRKIQRKPSDSVEEDGVGYAVGAPTESQTELLYRMVSNNMCVRVPHHSSQSRRLSRGPAASCLRCFLRPKERLRVSGDRSALAAVGLNRLSARLVT